MCISVESVLYHNCSRTVLSPGSNTCSFGAGAQMWTPLCRETVAVMMECMCRERMLTFSRLMTYIYICRTAPLISRCYILYIYSTNIRTEYFNLLAPEFGI